MGFLIFACKAGGFPMKNDHDWLVSRKPPAGEGSEDGGVTGRLNRFPRALLADEPTTGLDAFQAMDLCAPHWCDSKPIRGVN